MSPGDGTDLPVWGYQMVPLQGGKISRTVVDMKAIATGRFWFFMDLFHPGVITTHGFPHVKHSFLRSTWNPKHPFINGCLVKQPFSI